MATDYDSPRIREGDEPETDSLEALTAARRAAQNPNVDEVEATESEEYTLPGADLSDAVLELQVVPVQAGEHQCSCCFLIQQRSAFVSLDPPVCRDCA